MIATKFHRLLHVFGVQQLNGSKAESAQRDQESGIQYGDHFTGDTYIAAAIRDESNLYTL